MSVIEQIAAIALADPEPAAAAEAGPGIAAMALSSLRMEPAPIEPSWVLSGAPVARARVHSTSPDGFASTTLWDCTAGAFRWRFAWDETVVILEGSVEVTDEAGRVSVLKAGDAAFFAGGTEATWVIDDYVRKVAFCRRAFPKPVVAALDLKSRISRLLRRGPAAQVAGALGQPA